MEILPNRNSTTRTTNSILRDDLILIFTRNPELGKRSKTRLAASIGNKML
jgi:hypothetical protein